MKLKYVQRLASALLGLWADFSKDQGANAGEQLEFHSSEGFLADFLFRLGIIFKSRGILIFCWTSYQTAGMFLRIES